MNTLKGLGVSPAIFEEVHQREEVSLMAPPVLGNDRVLEQIFDDLVLLGRG